MKALLLTLCGCAGALTMLVTWLDYRARRRHLDDQRARMERRHAAERAEMVRWEYETRRQLNQRPFRVIPGGRNQQTG